MKPHRWPPHFLLWVEAALQLAQHKRYSAYDQIADMTGYSVGAVRARAAKMEANAKSELEWATAAAQRALPVRERPLDQKFKWPSKAALRGATGRIVKSPRVVVSEVSSTTPSDLTKKETRVP